MKNNKGITLIALVITIIVMLILVAVTINMSINGGLFGYSRNATVETKSSIENEKSISNVAEGLTPDQLAFKYETYGYTVTKYGDCNEDGSVNAIDVSILSRWIQNHTGMTAQGLINGDVNVDGILDDNDVQIITRYVKTHGGFELPYTE